MTRRRARWLACTVVAAGVAVTGLIVGPRILEHDPCDSAVPAATRLGLRLSGDDSVVQCEWRSSFPDSSGKIVVRTASNMARTALLKRSGLSEELDRRAVSLNDGPWREEIRRPNLTRAEQVYTTPLDGDEQLIVRYDDGVESGLLLAITVLA